MTNGTRWGWGVSVKPSCFLPPGKNQYPLYRRLGGPQGRSGQVWKISSHQRVWHSCKFCEDGSVICFQKIPLSHIVGTTAGHISGTWSFTSQCPKYDYYDDGGMPVQYIQNFCKFKSPCLAHQIKILFKINFRSTTAWLCTVTYTLHRTADTNISYYRSTTDRLDNIAWMKVTATCEAICLNWSSVLPL